MTLPYSPRRKPVGVSWRIKAGGLPREQRVEIYSRNYPKYPGRTYDDGQTFLSKRATFDELVISGLIHVEQLDERSYFRDLSIARSSR